MRNKTMHPKTPGHDRPQPLGNANPPCRGWRLSKALRAPMAALPLSISAKSVQTAVSPRHIRALLIGYWRLLGAAYADVVECIADGAEWLWHRVERLRSLAEIPASKLVEVLDFYHTSQYLSETIAMDRSMSKAQRQALYKRWRHALRHKADGVEVVMEELRALATTQRGTTITRALRYVEAHAHRMRYVTLETRKLSIGSGQVESAVRRVMNLRFKASGSFWTETTVSELMHLRAAFKAGRWDEVMIGVLTDPFQTPSFECNRSGNENRTHAAACTF